MSEPVLVCQSLSKVYHEGPQPVTVINDVNLSVAAGERIAILGASGSGKSTLLNLLGGLDLPESGSVHIAGEDLLGASESVRGHIRNRSLGFVYQFHHLMLEFTALENVMMPLMIRGDSKSQCEPLAAALLDKVGLSARMQHKPGQLSGGERQRVAIARALVTQPKCVLLDEPTGNLDRQAANQVHDLMLALSEGSATSFVVVTHDLDLARRMDRILSLEEGQLISQAPDMV